uniref:Exocyst complex component 2 n=1 Tax=Esox lucius TaxID=8010 RepID=A0A6Q2WVN5_ESOLU
MSRARQPPLVTGISPNEGTSWTKVTIRGENLGTGPADLIGLSICGHNCLLTAEWMSASKIVCRVGPAKDDKGEIIVTTKSGGHGTSTVSFKLLKAEKIGILDQSAVWVDEMNYYDMRTDRNKGISPLSLRPSNPLGIDVDKGKIPLKDLEGMFPGVSGDFTSENFSATWYLIENHSATSFDQLRQAASNLKKQATTKNEGSLAYVKGGLSTFFEAQDALAAIHQRLESDGTERVEGSMTQRLENILNRASDTADTLFQEVLGRKDKADSTRNALNVLQRFKFLFNLPLNIERNIQKGDYDVVINDYEKAKSLFGNTEVPVFKKVYAEVETRIGALRSLLLDKLLETPSTLHDQKRYIRYLSDLHAPGDPAWQCISAQHKWILGLMQNCREEFINDPRGESALGAIALDLDGDTRASALGRIRDTASLKRGVSLRSQRPNTWDHEAPQQVQFVEKLSDVVIGQLPNFWKLWISYVNGSLFSETGEKSGQVEKSKKNARQRQNDFKKMIEEVTHRLVKLVRGALLPSTLTEPELKLYGGWERKSGLTGPWLTQVIHTVRIIFEALVALEIPNDLLQVIQDLLLELRHNCLLVTLQHTKEDVRSLADKEDWVVDNEGVTSLPARFEQHACCFWFPTLLSRPLTCVSVCAWCIDSMSVDLVSPDLFSGVQEDFCPTPEQRLLIILSNCQHLEKHTFLNLAEHFERHGFTGTDKITQVSVQAVKELDESLFDNYIERKSDPIVGSLEPGIYAGYFDWRDCSTPTGTHTHTHTHTDPHCLINTTPNLNVSASLKTVSFIFLYITLHFDVKTPFLQGVRNYLKEALVNIITVHAEVFTVCKELVPRVLTRIVDGVAEEMSRLMQCVSSFSKNGAIQARLEINALRDAVSSYLSSESQ